MCGGSAPPLAMSGGGRRCKPDDGVFISGAEFARICEQLRAAGVDQRVGAQLAAAADSLEAAAIVAPRSCAAVALEKTLHHIAESGEDVLQVSKLIQANVSVDLKDDRGFTALHMAAESGHEAVVTALLEANADVNSNKGKPVGPIANGQTPLLVAVNAGEPKIASALLKAGAKVNMEDDYHQTPLYNAAIVLHYTERSYTSSTMMAILLEARAEVDRMGGDRDVNKGTTPLYIAAAIGSEVCVTVLLEANADRTLACIGKTPLAIAQEKGHTAVAALLR